MKIAAPVKDNFQIDNQFDQCVFYQIFTVNDKKDILFVETTEAPEDYNFKSKMAKKLKKEGVNILLAGMISAEAIDQLSEQGIEVVPNCEGNATEQVQLFLAGSLKD